MPREGLAAERGRSRGEAQEEKQPLWEEMCARAHAGRVSMRITLADVHVDAGMQISGDDIPSHPLEPPGVDDVGDVTGDAHAPNLGYVLIVTHVLQPPPGLKVRSHETLSSRSAERL